MAPTARDAWDIAFANPYATSEAPGVTFLRDAPVKVRATMQAVLEAVADAPPPAFAGAHHWQVMHGAMRGIYEVRVKGPNKRLYRLFCLLERAGPGLAHPTLIVLTGLSKPVRTAFSDGDYQRVRELRDAHLSNSPRRVVS